MPKCVNYQDCILHELLRDSLKLLGKCEGHIKLFDIEYTPGRSNLLGELRALDERLVIEINRMEGK